MRLSRIVPLVALVALGGCYRITVNTGAPAADTSIDKPWQLSFVYGLVPPPEVNAKETCTQGVSSVVTERSFLNGLVAVLSSSIVTPLHVTVRCASGPVAR